jgi:hypothetical protein
VKALMISSLAFFGKEQAHHLRITVETEIWAHGWQRAWPLTSSCESCYWATLRVLRQIRFFPPTVNCWVVFETTKTWRHSAWCLQSSPNNPGLSVLYPQTPTHLGNTPGLGSLLSLGAKIGWPVEQGGTKLMQPAVVPSEQGGEESSPCWSGQLYQPSPQPHIALIYILGTTRDSS